ncbi:MAG TPA: glutathione peroxidase [Burkholderiales bacterium]|nr:glutathione peroxidase [Burkholderiales bacterium]
MTSLYDFSAKSLDGDEVRLEAVRGKVALVVNTASRCGFTPQYEGLQELHRDFHLTGLELLAFPCNQFGKQEPGTSDDIARFCQRHYGVSFRMFEKIDVNGPAAHPLYKWLTAVVPGILGTRSIKWNFTKFLVDRNGNPVRRYGSWTKPKDIAPDIEKLLA